MSFRMIWLYRIFFWPVFLCLAPYYLFRMWKRGGYHACWWHRFGWVPKNKSSLITVWVQAVSVGELEALLPLFQRLKEKNLCIYLTTTTSTGFKIAHKRYQNLVDYIAYFPLDFWFFNRLAWNRIQPKMALLMESELWPEHLHTAQIKQVPLWVLNGRCSDRSFKRYQRIPKIAHFLFNQVEKILAASELDRQRFIELGVSEQSVCALGNLKVDAALARLDISQISVTDRNLLGTQWVRAPILLGASTWPGEEKFLLQFYLRAHQQYPTLKLILVPRHAERAQEIVALFKEYRVHFTRRSQLETNCDVCLVDTTGELRQFVRLADFVFVGKSLAPNQGGQTPIEAAAAGKPIVYGPHMQNFRAICQSLEQAKAAVRCKNTSELENCLWNWLKNPGEAQNLGQRAQIWAQTNAGATQRTLQILLTRLSVG